MIFHKVKSPHAAQPAQQVRYRLAVVCSFYGFAGFHRPVANVRRFIRQMEREGVAVYGAEAHTGTPRLADLGWLSIEAGEDQILWQKEALLNLAAQAVPAEYNALAWIDPDVWLTNPHWKAQAEDRLRDHSAVQLFEEALWTERDGSIGMRRECAARAGGVAGHPGFAWALRRAKWPLPAHFCTGSGDQEMVREWKAAGDCSWISGQCVHEWHGQRADRQYYDRHTWRAGLAARDCVVRAPNGLMSWSDKAPAELRTRMREYFFNRKEDG